MNVMIISDDHGVDVFAKAYKHALGKYKVIDAVIHAGDSEQVDADYYTKICGNAFFKVKGNNDFDRTPPFLDLKMCGKNIFVTHGHNYGVYMGLNTLYLAGQEHAADVIVYGHTHRAYNIEANGVELINPGSLGGIRSGSKSYVVLGIQENGGMRVEFNYI